MAFVSISDIHVRSREDERYTLLLNFLNHDLTKSAEEIFFLGDIFDLMIGPHLQYTEIYHEFFLKILDYIKLGKNIYYFQGNHDLHVEKLFNRFFKKHGVKADNFHLCNGPKILKINGKNYYFSHGDEIEPGNYSYKIYKILLISRPLNWFINNIAPFQLVEKIGKNASKTSKKINRRNYNSEKTKVKFRTGAKKTKQGLDFDFLFCGHSHIEESIELPSEMTPFFYFNNGFIPQSKKFIHFDNGKANFISLV